MVLPRVIFDVQWATAHYIPEGIRFRAELIIFYPLFYGLVWECDGLTLHIDTQGQVGKFPLDIIFSRASRYRPSFPDRSYGSPSLLESEHGLLTPPVPTPPRHVQPGTFPEEPPLKLELECDKPLSYPEMDEGTSGSELLHQTPNDSLLGTPVIIPVEPPSDLHEIHVSAFAISPSGTPSMLEHSIIPEDGEQFDARLISNDQEHISITLSFISCGRSIAVIVPEAAYHTHALLINPKGIPLRDLTFPEAIECGAMFEDRSAFIAPLLRKGCISALGSRPASGRTFFLSLMRAYLDRESSYLHVFDRCAIAQWPFDEMHRGQHRVLFLDLGTLSTVAGHAFYESVAVLTRMHYRMWLNTCIGALPPAEAATYQTLAYDTDATMCANMRSGVYGALGTLCRYIFQATGSRPILLVDRYDILLRGLWHASRDTLTSILPFVTLFLTMTLTENKCTYGAVIAGGTEAIPSLRGNTGDIEKENSRLNADDQVQEWSPDVHEVIPDQPATRPQRYP
ncbi:AAA-ATPase like protein [Giardia muris]|uniref:AAA-ATPase like protein n=1 Tax=Giardia muris TaxID=5742 RepID=A0A4Z1T2Z2_GIAMU|nr:AAA-ATPase like protein [Giardia muris]|eukprot:TNJ28313.1 AAA-ATPase like protein [Giardia muris]